MSIFNYKIEKEADVLVIGGFQLEDVATYVYERKEGKQVLYVFLKHIRESKEIQQVPVKGKGGKWEVDEQVTNVKSMMPVMISSDEDIKRFITVVNSKDACGDLGKLDDYEGSAGKQVPETAANPS